VKAFDGQFAQYRQHVYGRRGNRAMTDRLFAKELGKLRLLPLLCYRTSGCIYCQAIHSQT
jgi:hypothetical protein